MTASLPLFRGADSDVMLDILERTNTGNKPITYCFFDTGIEYAATKEHLEYLEQKYGICIERFRAKCPVPLATKKYGIPFLSKRISMYLGRLQKHNFDWSNEPVDILLERFPRCKSAIRWWCNDWGEKSPFNINRNTWLKEFIIANPPTFKISDDCCTKAKKNTAHDAMKMFDADMSCIGVRKAESGIRSIMYHNCFSPAGDDGVANYRPLFFLEDIDRQLYEETYDVCHSKCYTEYGLKRTGCAGCPFGSRFEDELKIIEQHEPKLFKAINNIFGPSYEYTRAYRKFRDEMKAKARGKS